MLESIGPYKVISQLGRGGMGVVYKGRDESLNRFVAIKVLTENLSEDPTFLQRFVREAQAAASLSHPNVVQIYFTGQDDAGHPYFVMEFVSGQSLDHVLRSEGRIDDPRASQLMLQAAHGLAAAHDLGIIHRDIKPANLILDDRGMLKIADFGLALPAGAEKALTATGMFMGTPGYLSPEQCSGEKADNRTDIYALGVTYYMLLTGTPPFRGESPLALMKQIFDGNPPDVTTINPNIDPESRRILAKMIAKDREQRYQNCHELVADLENLLASMGVRSMTAGLGTRTPAAPAAVVAAVAAQTTVVGRENTRPTLPPTAEVTMPEMRMTAAPTSPAFQPAFQPEFQPATSPAFQPAIPPPPMKRGLSTPTLLVAASLVLLLLAGGAVGAVVYGKRLLRSVSAETQVAAAKPLTAAPASTVPGSNPPEGVLLSGALAVPQRADQSAPQSLSETDPAPATTQAEQSTARPAAPATRQPGQTSATQRQASIPVVAPAREAKRRGAAGVAVAAIGDPVVLGAVSSVLRSEAESAGLEVIDAHALPSTEDMLQRRVAVRDLVDQLRDDGYAVLMLARVEPTGQRELSYYGRRDTSYQARVTVTAYDLATGRPFGTPQSGSMSYTSINVDSESEDVVTPLARAAARAIRDR